MNKPDYTPAFRSETPGIESKSAALKPRSDGSLAPIDVLAEVPALDVWLANLRSPQTRKAYRKDVVDFIESLDVHSHEELYRVKPAAVLAWRHMLEGRELKASTIRRKLAALSSLFTHLVAQHLCEFNPVRDIKRPSISRGKGSTASFSQEQARKILNAPPSDTVQGLRDRAILSVGMQLGPRRTEIAHLIVSDLHMHNGHWCLKVLRKGGKEGREVINPETERRIRAYLDKAKHGEDLDGPMFRPTRKNHVEGTEDMRRHLASKTINRVIQHWCKVAIGISSGFSAHSMRATFATRALSNGADLVNVKKALGHADVSTTLIYDHRADDPEQAASAFAKY